MSDNNSNNNTDSPAGNNSNDNDSQQQQQDNDESFTIIPSTPDRAIPGTPSRRQQLQLGTGNQDDDDDEMEPMVPSTPQEPTIPPTPQSLRSSMIPSTPTSTGNGSRRVRRRLGSNNDNDNDNDNANINDNTMEEEVPPTPMSGGNSYSSAAASIRQSTSMNIRDSMSVGTLTTAGYGSYGGNTTVRSTSSSNGKRRGTDGKNNGDDNDNQDNNSSVLPVGEFYDQSESEVESVEEENEEQNFVSPTSHQPPTGNLMDDDEAEMMNSEQSTVFRGTDINVRSVTLAFKDFLQNFISLQESEKTFKKSERDERNKTRREKRQLRKKAKEAVATAGGDDHDDHDDGNLSVDESLSSIDSYYSDDEETKRPLYIDRLRDILLGRHRRVNPSQSDQSETMISSNAIETNASLDLNTLHLYYHSPQCQRLYHQLMTYPGEVIPLMDLIVVREMEALLAQLHTEKNEADEYNVDEYKSLHPISIPVPRVQVRPFHLKSLSHMRALDPQSIDNLLSIRGMVVRTSPVIPDLKVAHFQCCVCSHTNAVTLERGRVSEPTICANCNIKNTFELIHNRSLFADKQMVRIQETPNEVPPGETPASIVLFAYDDMVDAVRPGDRIEVTGVFRAQGRRVNPKISKVKSVYKTYLDVIHFRRVSGETQNASSKHDDGNNNEGQGKGTAIENFGGKLSDKRIQELEALSRSANIYERLVSSLAPSIWELDDVKRGVLCMLFGGNSKRVKKGTAERRKRKERERADKIRNGIDDSDSDQGMLSDDESVDDDGTSKLKKRGDINILLCGDPGTSKSQLLSYVHKLAPRGVYTSGKGSSAVGLTASVVRDPETKDLVLESGALVLSDLGVCCIDEFDKMSDTTRAILHEAMEQQTVSIAKAGIIATLNARTSILASANPVESRYNPQMSVVDNIKLPPTLLSRFDLIYLILDAPNVESDRRLAQHLVGLYYETPNVVQPPLDQNLLRDYIAYARDNIFPELSDLATRELISAYLEMRKMGVNSGNGSRTISATPRQLESLVRLSEGLAKMRYSRVVERSDVKEAVRLMKVATQAAATDPRTGRIDMDMITTGRSTANREMEEALNLSLKELLAEVRICSSQLIHLLDFFFLNVCFSSRKHRDVEIEWL